MHRWVVLLTCLSAIFCVRPLDAEQLKDVSQTTPQRRVTRSAVIDVELRPGGVLRGVAVDENGHFQAGIAISARRSDAQITQVTTDKAGRFEISGLHGGVYQIVVDGSQRNCRVWQAGTAPPTARRDLLLVTGIPVERGQREFGSLLYQDHLLFALILAGAIAIPIIVNAQDDDNPSGS